MKRVAVALGVLVALEGTASALPLCQGRPTDPAGYQGYAFGSVEVKTYDTTHVRVHYATSGSYAPSLTSTRPDGVPDAVGLAGDIGEDALTKYAAMGFKEVPSDAACTSNGGDARVDIYLVPFSGADGSTVADACDGPTCSSFVLCKAGFLNAGYANDKEGFETVVSHELFHAVQNVYDHELDRFWAEGTAQWAMKTLHPELQDFERQLPSFFSAQNQSLDAQPQGVTSGFLYGSAVWPLFLTLTHGDDFVKLTLEAEAAGAKAMPAIDAVLQTKGSSLADAFPMFGAWNVATKDLAGTGGYPDAAKYPGTKTATLEDGAKGITSGFASYAFRGTLDGKKSISLDTDATRNAGVVVPIVDGKARIDQAAKLPADAEGDVVVVVAGITSKKTDGPFTIHFGDPTGTSSSSSSSSGGSSSSSSGGCSCTTTSSSPSFGTALFAVVAGLVVAARRRR